MKEKMDGSMFIGTWWSLVPPLLAIVLAFLTKEVYSSLFVGVAVGALLYTGFSPWDSFVSFFEIMKESMNLNILIFDVLLGMIIVLMAKSGGSAAYGNWAGSKIRSKKSALLATTGLGVLIFVDDYFNCLTVGSVMRPVTDRYKVSRAKLAYIIDSTAALQLEVVTPDKTVGSAEVEMAVCPGVEGEFGVLPQHEYQERQPPHLPKELAVQKG